MELHSNSKPLVAEEPNILLIRLSFKISEFIKIISSRIEKILESKEENKLEKAELIT